MGEAHPELELMTADEAAAWLRQVGRTRTVRTFLPRFKMTSMFRLEKVLAAMGMADAFSPRKADFSGMTGKRAIEYGLYITSVIHKAFVEVNEKGTEAAAVTAVVMAAPTSAPVTVPFTPTFKADRPFLFLIRDRVTGSILFLGRVTNPKG